MTKIKPMSDEKLLSTNDVAEELGISRQRVLQLVKSGRLNSLKIANVHLFKLEDLEPVRNRVAGKPKKKTGK